MGGRTASSGLGNNITDLDWVAWAEDPEPFQSALSSAKPNKKKKK